MRAMFSRWNHSIGLRFTLLSFLLVFFISIAFIAVESYFSSRREYHRLNMQISQIEESHVPSIVYSLWLTDYDLLRSQLEATVRFPYILYVQVEDDEGQIFRAGNKEGGGVTVHSMDLQYTRRDSDFYVGKMEIHINERGIWTSILKAELVPVLGHIFITILIAVTVAVLFKKQVGRHIEQLARYVHQSKGPEVEDSFQLVRTHEYDDELQRLVSAVNDMRESLTAHIKEKELLMGEVHHRVKNDLAFIIAFLMLQANATGSAEAAEALNEASQRVSVMSDIYKQIFLSSDFRAVDLSSVLHTIINDIMRKAGLSSENFSTSIDIVEVPIRVSVAYGIILNELLTNTMKYSLAAENEIHVTVSLTAGPSKKHLARLTVKDNGEGFPEQVLRGEKLGYGLSIVKTLIEQYNGEFLIFNQGGANVDVLI